MNPPPGLRLAVVLSHPTQYYSPWFRWLASNTDLDLRVFYLWDFGTAVRRDPQFQKAFRWDVDLLSGYASEFVPNLSRDPGTHRFFGLRNPALCERLDAWEPGALLLYGYKWMSHLRAVAWARRRRVPVIFRGDSHLLGRPIPDWRRRFLLRRLFRRFAAFAYVGRANREYFEAFGVPENRLFFCPHSVDDRLFDPGGDRNRAAAAALRRELGLPDGTRVVLFAGKLIASKQPRELLKAFMGLKRPDAALIFVGEGEEKQDLQAMAGEAARGTVHFLPFANQTEMPARYLLADLFALPSRGSYETWGLAVNEAMHMGIPCLVSDRVGCQRDLVTPGQTGWVFRSDSPEDLSLQLAAALAAVADPAAAERLRRNVSARIAGFTYANSAKGLISAIDFVAKR
ncbi:MAG: glycosyltransferase family 4 protein [Opitutaceae bacterium]